MKNHIILCPLKDNKMTLLPEVMEKLNVKPGDNITVVKKDGIVFLCGPEIDQDNLTCESEYF